MNFEQKKITIALRRALSLGGVAITVACGSVWAQQQPTRVERIEVTGTNIKRIEGETSLPVTVITREEIDRSGAQTAFEFLQNLSVTNGGPFNELRAVGSSVPGNFASLRGLGSTATLVLLDGRRLSNFAYGGSTLIAVDLNSIPIAAIERIEVLRDGASAIYGSDAIAGVINFILRKDFTGVEVTGYMAETRHRDATEKRGTVSAGFGTLAKNKFNIFVSADYRDQEGVMLSERDFARTSFIPSRGIDGRSASGTPGSFAFVTAPNTFRPAPDCPADRRAVNAQGIGFCVQDVTPLAAMITPSTKTSLYGRLTVAFGEHTLTGEAAWSRNEVENRIAPSPIQDTVRGPFRMPASSPYNTFGQDVNVRWRTIQLGPRITEVETESSRYLLSLAGAVFGRWDYNVGVGVTRSEAESAFKSGYLSESRLREALLAGRVNGLGDTRQQDFAALQAVQAIGQIRKSEAETRFVDGKVSGELFQLPGGPLGIAAGFEFREEEINDQPAEFIRSGDVVGGVANQPIKAERDAKAFFAELNVPIWKSLEINPAVRYDDYSDFGNSTNPKVGVRWQPIPQLLFRSAWGTGFRAPGLGQLYQPQVAAFAASRADDPLRCGRPGAIQTDCNTQYPTRSGGNPSLKPEESEQFSIGVVWEPFQSLSGELTWWKINKTQDITSPSVTTILTNIGRFGDRVVRFPQDPSDVTNGLPGRINFVNLTLVNLGNTRVSGYDVDLRYRFPTTAAGRFQVRTSSTYIQKYRSQLDGRNYTVMEGRFINETPLPQWRHNVWLFWDMGPWAATVGYNFIDDYEDVAGNPTFRVDSWHAWDVQGSYTGLFLKGLKLTLGVKNLFDETPPFSRGSVFAPGWDNLTHDPRGRTYYGSLTYSFK